MSLFSSHYTKLFGPSPPELLSERESAVANEIRDHCLFLPEDALQRLVQVKKTVRSCLQCAAKFGTLRELYTLRTATANQLLRALGTGWVHPLLPYTVSEEPSGISSTNTFWNTLCKTYNRSGSPFRRLMRFIDASGNCVQIGEDSSDDLQQHDFSSSPSPQGGDASPERAVPLTNILKRGVTARQIERDSPNSASAAATHFDAPFTDDNSFLVQIKLCRLTPTHTADDICCALFFTLDWVSTTFPTTARDGVTFLIDMEAAATSTVEALMRHRLIVSVVSRFFQTFPVKVRRVLVVNCPVMMGLAIRAVNAFLPQKIASRVFVVQFESLKNTYRISNVELLQRTEDSERFFFNWWFDDVVPHCADVSPLLAELLSSPFTRKRMRRLRKSFQHQIKPADSANEEEEEGGNTDNTAVARSLEFDGGRTIAAEEQQLALVYKRFSEVVADAILLETMERRLWAEVERAAFAEIVAAEQRARVATMSAVAERDRQCREMEIEQRRLARKLATVSTSTEVKARQTILSEEVLDYELLIRDWRRGVEILKRVIAAAQAAFDEKVASLMLSERRKRGQIESECRSYVTVTLAERMLEEEAKVVEKMEQRQKAYKQRRILLYRIESAARERISSDWHSEAESLLTGFSQLMKVLVSKKKLVCEEENKRKLLAGAQFTASVEHLTLYLRCLVGYSDLFALWVDFIVKAAEPLLRKDVQEEEQEVAKFNAGSFTVQVGETQERQRIAREQANEWVPNCNLEIIEGEVLLRQQLIDFEGKEWQLHFRAFAEKWEVLAVNWLDKLSDEVWRSEEQHRNSIAEEEHILFVSLDFWATNSTKFFQQWWNDIALVLFSRIVDQNQRYYELFSATRNEIRFRDCKKQLGHTVQLVRDTVMLEEDTEWNDTIEVPFRVGRAKLWDSLSLSNLLARRRETRAGDSSSSPESRGWRDADNNNVVGDPLMDSIDVPLATTIGGRVVDEEEVEEDRQLVSQLDANETRALQAFRSQSFKLREKYAMLRRTNSRRISIAQVDLRIEDEALKAEKRVTATNESDVVAIEDF